MVPAQNYRIQAISASKALVPLTPLMSVFFGGKTKRKFVIKLEITIKILPSILLGQGTVNLVFTITFNLFFLFLLYVYVAVVCAFVYASVCVNLCMWVCTRVCT